jgi:hypothetical protein
MTKIHLLTATPMGILIVYRDRLWHFRVLANNSIYGQANGYYTAQAALGQRGLSALFAQMN